MKNIKIICFLSIISIVSIVSILMYGLPQAVTDTQPVTQQQVALVTQAAYDPKPTGVPALSALRAAEQPETATAYAASVEGKQAIQQTGMPTKTKELITKPLDTSPSQISQPKESDDINAAKAQEYYPGS